MINLNEAQTKSIKDMAYNLIEPYLCAINIEVDEQDFIDDLRTPGTPVRLAYYQGYLSQLTEIRMSLIKSAHNGSNPAQNELLKLLTKIQNHITHE